MTEQNPWQNPGTTPAAPHPREPAPAVSDPAAPLDQPELATDQPDAKSDPAVSLSDTAAPVAGVGDLCTYTVEDDAGFTTLNTCLVLEVFTEPDEDGQEVQLARVAMLPDERIVTAARLEPRS